MDRPSRRLQPGSSTHAKPSSSVRPRGAPGSAGAERAKPASGTMRPKEDSNLRRKPGSAVRKPEVKEEPQEEVVEAEAPAPAKPPAYDYEFKEDPPEPDTRKKTAIGAPRGPRTKSSRFPNPVDIAANADPLAPSKQRTRNKRGAEGGGNPNTMYAMIGGGVLLIAIIGFAMSGGDKKPAAKKTEHNKATAGVDLMVESVNWASRGEGQWNVSGRITNKGDTAAEKVSVVCFPCGDYARVTDKGGKSKLVVSVARIPSLGAGESMAFTTETNIPAIKSDGMTVYPEDHAGPFVTYKGCPSPSDAVAEAIFDPLEGDWGGTETEMQKKRAEGFKKGDGS